MSSYKETIIHAPISSCFTRNKITSLIAISFATSKPNQNNKANQKDWCMKYNQEIIISPPEIRIHVQPSMSNFQPWDRSERPVLKHWAESILINPVSWVAVHLQVPDNRFSVLVICPSYHPVPIHCLFNHFAWKITFSQSCMHDYFLTDHWVTKPSTLVNK